MSADNYSECPLCKKRKEEEKAELEKQKDKVTFNEFISLENEFREKWIEYSKEAVREDYEQGVDDKGLAYAIFKAQCQDCGASWKIDVRDVLPEDKEDIQFVKERLK